MSIARMERDEFVAVPYLRQGQLISLIRWSHGSDDWRYTTVLAEYLHRDADTWYVIVDGSRSSLPRAEWAIFS